jgi:hypothetical protein
MSHKGYTRMLLTVFLVGICVSVSAQQTDSTENQELTLTIGDTITFSTICDSGVYNYIDVYTKTRFSDSVLNYNPITGEGFYKTFFAEGDFDARRLSCDYADQKFTITSTQYFTDNKTGEDRFVVFVMIGDWKVAWVEFIDAYEAGEILLY